MRRARLMAGAAYSELRTGALMDKTDLRDALMSQLWRMYKMDIMLYLREFLVGETALLEYIASQEGAVTPTAMSEDMHLSRARTANILRTLREKGYVSMEIDSDDRRRMNVTPTDAGIRYLKDKHAFLEKYFDMYVDVLGEENISQLTALLKVTADSEKALWGKFGKIVH